MASEYAAGWSPESHNQCPEAVKARVYTLLLIFSSQHSAIMNQVPPEVRTSVQAASIDSQLTANPGEHQILHQLLALMV